MKDFIDLGPVPAEEEPIQLGSTNYSSEEAEKECSRYIKLIKEKVGSPPDGARLSIISNPHELGNYYSVVCWFSEEDPSSVEYAFRCESEGPTQWN